MRIGPIEAKKGDKIFGFLEFNRSRGQFPLKIPLHIIEGTSQGPVLLIQAGHSGLEIEHALTLATIVEALDPRELSGTVLVVPLLNVWGFEFGETRSPLDNKDLNAIGRGVEHGTTSEELVYNYYAAVVSKSDAVLDVHSGALWGYYRYVSAYDSPARNEAIKLATAMDFRQVMTWQPDDSSIACSASKDGKTIVSIWIGGGPGLRDFRSEDTMRLRTAVNNAMKHLHMLQGNVERRIPNVQLIEPHTFIRSTDKRGLILMLHEKRGSQVKGGEKIGSIIHPYTGNLVEELKAPQDGILLHAGSVWPLPPEGSLLAILGNLREELRFT